MALSLLLFGPRVRLEPLGPGQPRRHGAPCVAECLTSQTAITQSGKSCHVHPGQVELNKRERETEPETDRQRDVHRHRANHRDLTWQTEKDMTSLDRHEGELAKLLYPLDKHLEAQH